MRRWCGRQASAAKFGSRLATMPDGQQQARHGYLLVENTSSQYVGPGKGPLWATGLFTWPHGPRAVEVKPRRWPEVALLEMSSEGPIGGAGVRRA